MAQQESPTPSTRSDTTSTGWAAGGAGDHPQAQQAQRPGGGGAPGTGSPDEEDQQAPAENSPGARTAPDGVSSGETVSQR